MTIRSALHRFTGLAAALAASVALLVASAGDSHADQARAATRKFKPTKLSGQPVKVTGVIQYNFVSQ